MNFYVSIKIGEKMCGGNIKMSKLIKYYIQLKFEIVEFITIDFSLDSLEIYVFN